MNTPVQDATIKEEGGRAGGKVWRKALKICLKNDHGAKKMTGEVENDEHGNEARRK